MKTFETLGLSESILVALNKEGIAEPTEIQYKSIPLVLAQHDVVGQSETGTGKTLAYLLPIIQKLDTQKREMQVLILTPTHELALQIHRQIEGLAHNSGLPITSALIIGNVNITRQIEKLKEKPHILVGSSGRILELIQKRKITSQSIRTVVLDEVDRLLDDHNLKTVQAVIKTTLRDRQLLFFSATLAPVTLERIKELSKKPDIVRVSPQAQVAPNISHQYFFCEQREKIEVLRKVIRIINPERALIFINTSEKIEETVDKLKYHGLNVVGIHGNTIKSDRGKAMTEFKGGNVQLLVASDLAARGLDIQGITHVINLDQPEDPQLYLHRVGRTGRAGKSGIAISIVTEKELPLLRRVENLFKITIGKKEMYQGKIIDPCQKNPIAPRKPPFEKTTYTKNSAQRDKISSKHSNQSLFQKENKTRESNLISSPTQKVPYGSSQRTVRNTRSRKP